MNEVEVTLNGTPFAEAIQFLKDKINLPSRRWDELLGQIHAKVFTVAGAISDDLLNDLRNDVNESIKNGESISKFRKRFDETKQKHGWNHRGKRGWRTRIIYDANMRSAHMAGRWQQIQNTKDSRPYIKYETVGDNRVRPEHQVWDDTVLSIDDSWWNTHYPPNGFGCRCTVRTLNDRQLEREGLQVSTAPAIKLEERINSETGEVYGQVPEGIDTGWDYNVGKEWLNL